MERRSVALIVAVIMAATVFMVIPFSGSASAEDTVSLAQPDDISVSPSINNIDLNAGESITVYLEIYNKFDREVIVYVYYIENDPDIDIEFVNGHRIEIAPGHSEPCEMVISVNKYARSTDHALTFDIMLNDPLRGSTIRADASDSLMITVSSELSAGKQYNKILGVIDNHLPGALGSPLATTIITFMIWLLVAIVVAYFIVPIVFNVGKRTLDETEKIKRRWKE